MNHRYPHDLRERIIGALGAVLAVALVIGLVAGAVAWGAVHATGLDDQPAPAGDEAPSAPAEPPSSSSAASPSASPDEQQTREADPRAARPETGSAKHRHHARKHQALTLTASSRHVSSMGRVDLGGRYPGHSGATLVVQRREGGHWSRFPVSVTVRGGSFHTWVASGQHGPNAFRVLDPATGRVSGSVTVVVG